MDEADWQARRAAVGKNPTRAWAKYLKMLLTRGEKITNV
jgi:hypothetical protein